MSGSAPTRRQVLALGAAACFAPGVAHAAALLRVAAIDWGVVETMLALDVVPVAATELRQFRLIAVEPVVPDSVADLGLRGAPNYELLRSIRPDLVLISGFYEYQRAALERVAPVESFAFYAAGTPPFALAQASALAIGDRLGRSDSARRYVKSVNAYLAECRAAVARLSGRPVFVISLGDSRHFRAFGADSMFGDVLGRLGLRNAWSDPTSYSAAAPVAIEALARVPEAAIVIVAPLPADVQRALPDNALWNALPAVRESRVAVLDPVNHFGGLPSAQRFAGLFADAVARWPGAHG